MTRLVVVGLVLLLSACTTMPTGPGILVLPAPGKSLEEFQVEDSVCRQWAARQTGMSAQDTATQNTVKSAAVGTAIGAGAGALLGSTTGDAGSGAAFGAGAGLLMGTAAGAGAGQSYGWEVQERYDYAYVQCMYVKGNQIPGQVHRYRIRKVTPSANPERYTAPPDYRPD
jgi:hypothetical protein